jgi:hypothetical protein
LNGRIVHNHDAFSPLVIFTARMLAIPLSAPVTSRYGAEGTVEERGFVTVANMEIPREQKSSLLLLPSPRRLGRAGSH